MTIYAGDTGKVLALFTADEISVDPDTLTLVVTKPDNTTESFSYADEEITRVSRGHFEKEITFTQAGTWRFTWTPTGDTTQPVYDSRVVVAARELFTFVVENGSTPWPNVMVTLFAPGGEQIVASGRTNASGQFVASVSPNESAPYVVELSSGAGDLAGMIVPKRESVWLTDSDDPVDLTVDVPTIVVFEPSRKVFLFGYVQSPNGEEGETTIIIESVTTGSRAFLESTGTLTGLDPRTVLTSRSRREIRSNRQTGMWGLSVVAGARLRVQIPSIRYDAIFTVPNRAEVTQLNIRDVRPDAGPGGGVGVVADVPTFDSLKGIS